MRKSYLGAAVGLSAAFAVGLLAVTPAEAGGKKRYRYYQDYAYGCCAGVVVGSAYIAPPAYAYTETYYSPYAPDYPPYHSGYAYTWETITPPAYYQPSYRTYTPPPHPSAYQTPGVPPYESYKPAQPGSYGSQGYGNGYAQNGYAYQGYQGYQGNGGAPAQGSADWYSYCWSKYPDFDPKSGTYGGPGGQRLSCR